MKNLKSIVITVIGVSAFVLALTLNLRHIANDYGVLTGKLNIEVLAQTGTGGTGTGTGTGTGQSGGGEGLPSVSFNWIGIEYQGQAGIYGPSWQKLWPALTDCTISSVSSFWCYGYSGGSSWHLCSFSGGESIAGYKMKCVYGWGNCSNGECAATQGVIPPSYLPPNSSHFQ